MSNPASSDRTSRSGSDPRSSTPFRVTFVLVIIAAYLPWDGRLLILATLFPLIIVTIFYRFLRCRLADVGLDRPEKPFRLLGIALTLAVLDYVLEAVTVHPLARALFDQPKDHSLFEPMKGNLGMLLMYLFFMWLVAAFGEEFIWRAFVLRELAERWGESRQAWLGAIVVSSLLFGLIHFYQGPRGVLNATFGGAFLGVVFVVNGGRSLWLPILIHGLTNTFSFVLIYLDLYKVVNFWVE